MNLRVTMFFSAGYYSWTESWWNPNWSAIVLIANNAAKLATLRAGLLGYGASITNVRITSDAGTRQAFNLPVGSYQTSGLGSTAVVGQGTSDEPYSSILIRFSSLDSYNKDVYLSGYPDGLVTVGGTTPPTTGVGPAWLNAFNLWAAELKNAAWAWRSKQRGIGFGLGAPVQNIVVNALPPGLLGALVLQGNTNFIPGEQVQLSGFNRIQGRRGTRQINGIWTVDSTASSTNPLGTIYYLRGSNGVDTTQINRFGTISQQQYTFREIFTVSFQGVTHRKRGVRSGRPLGRSKIR